MKSTTALLGYFSPLSTKPTQKSELKISSNGPKYCIAEIMRVICADIDPNGPGQEFEKVDWFEQKKIKVKNKHINAGSFALINPAPNLKNQKIITIKLHIFPTMTKGTKQVILHWNQLSLGIDPDQKLYLIIGEECILEEVKTEIKEWKSITIILDVQNNLVKLISQVKSPFTEVKEKNSIKKTVKKLNLPNHSNPLLLAAQLEKYGHELQTTLHYNGKIVSPMIIDNKSQILSHWDFSLKMKTEKIIDVGQLGCNGKLINLPMRASTDHNWNGSCHSWLQDKSQYGAIHFHEDDITDCNWSTDLTVEVPEDAKSGYYIARLTSEGVQSDIPFFIGVNEKMVKADILFIAPIATYMAYANTHIKFDSHNTENLFEAPVTLSEDELYLNENRALGLSHYDTHADGSGVVYSSAKRPILNMRPGLYTFNYVNDTHIIKWLENRSIQYEVATDEQLHNQGIRLLSNYKVIITASHPEYYSTQMWDAIFAFQNSGGRHMYLGGNGFYWRIAYSDLHCGIIENRRGASGVRTWEGEPGEHHLSFNGELGGLWRANGRAPQMLVGNGFCATYFLKSTHFKKKKVSNSKEISFIFNGVEGQAFGDFGYRGGGCVGLEIDRFDSNLGSPKNTVILATSEDVGSAGLLTGEEFITTTRALDGSQHSHVRADMTIFTTIAGGAVWSTGSIAWATSLLWNNSQNDVSRITENVLNRFLDPQKINLPKP